MDQFLPRLPYLHTGIAEWMAVMIFVISQHKKMPAEKLMSRMAITLVIQCTLQYLATIRTLWFWQIGVALAFLIIFETIRNMCDMDKKDALYSSIRAYILAQFAASFEWQIYCYFVHPLGLVRFWDRCIRGLLLIASYTIIYYVAYRIELRYRPVERKLSIGTSELTTAFIIGGSTFVISIIGFLYAYTPFSARYDSELFIIRTLSDFAGATILYGHFILSYKIREARELNQINTILKRQYDQYVQSRDNIELLNIRFHDMKNQIAAIRAEADSARQEEYLTDLENHLKCRVIPEIIYWIWFCRKKYLSVLIIKLN